VNLVVAERKPGELNILQTALLVGIIHNLYNKLLTDSDKEYKAFEYMPAHPAWLLGKTGSADTQDTYDRVITWDVMRREDGTLGKSPFSGTKQKRPALREEVPITRDDGTKYVREIYGKFYDNLLRFDCFAPTATEAHDTLIKFERMLENHAMFFENQGVSKFLYHGRTSPLYLENARYHTKACIFYVRTEEMWYRDEDTIKKIELQANSELRTWTSGSDLTGISGEVY